MTPFNVTQPNSQISSGSTYGAPSSSPFPAQLSTHLLRGSQQSPKLDTTNIARTLLDADCSDACLLKITNSNDGSLLFSDCFTGECHIKTPAERITINMECSKGGSHSNTNIGGLSTPSNLQLSGIGVTVYISGSDQTLIEGDCASNEPTTTESSSPTTTASSSDSNNQSSSASRRLPSAATCMRTLAVASLLLFANG